MRHMPAPFRNNQVINQQDIEYVLLPDAAESQEKTLHDYLQIVLRRKWLVVLPLFLILPFVVMDVLIQKPEYKARATLLIEKTRPNVISIEEVLKTDNSPDFYRTQQEIIKSRAVAEEVVDTLQLHKRQREEDPPLVQTIQSIRRFPSTMLRRAVTLVTKFFADKPEPVPQSAKTTKWDPTEMRHQMSIAWLQDALKVEPREGTQLVDISLKGTNPQETTRIVNTVAETYVRQNLEHKLDASRNAIIWLKNEAESLKAKIHNSELGLHEFKKANTFISLEDSAENLVVKEINNLQRSYIELSSSRTALQTSLDELRQLARKPVEQIPELSSLNNTIIGSLKSKYKELKFQYDSLLKDLTPNHPRMLLISYEIDNIRISIKNEINKILKGMESEYKVLSIKEDIAKKELEKKKGELLDLSKSMTVYSELTRELSIDKDLYQAVSQRLAETTLTQALEKNNIKIIEPALVPTFPVSSGAISKILLGIIASLGLGVGLAFVVDNLDKRFKSVESVERDLGVPFLGLIPQYKAKKVGLITLHDRWSTASEAYRSVRTWIQLAAQSGQPPLKTMMITSAIAGEGKSTTAANLGVSFGQLGWKTLVLDVDLRRSALHHIFNVPHSAGLTDVIENGDDWQQLLQKTSLDNVKVLPSGHRVDNPSELLSSNQMKVLIDEVKKAFDIVIFDAPVSLTIPDVAILAPDVDGILLVHCPIKGNRDVVLEAKRILDRAGASLLGVVFNRVRPKEQNYYHYKYSYYQAPYHPVTPTPSSPDRTYVDMLPPGQQNPWRAEAGGPYLHPDDAQRS